MQIQMFGKKNILQDWKVCLGFVLCFFLSFYCFVYLICEEQDIKFGCFFLIFRLVLQKFNYLGDEGDEEGEGENIWFMILFIISFKLKNMVCNFCWKMKCDIKLFKVMNIGSKENYDRVWLSKFFW